MPGTRCTSRSGRAGSRDRFEEMTRQVPGAGEELPEETEEAEAVEDSVEAEADAPEGQAVSEEPVAEAEAAEEPEEEKAAE